MSMLKLKNVRIVLNEPLTHKNITIKEIYFRTEVASLVSGGLACGSDFELEDIGYELENLAEDDFTIDDFNYYGFSTEDLFVDSAVVDITDNNVDVNSGTFRKVVAYDYLVALSLADIYTYSNDEFKGEIAKNINDKQDWDKEPTYTQLIIPELEGFYAPIQS